MPIHADWQPLWDSLMQSYCDVTVGTDTSPKGGPCGKGEQVFYAYCTENNIDYTQPRPKEMEAFQWVGSLTPEEREGRYFVRGQAIHPCKTYHPQEWPEVRVYLEEELKASAPTLTGKPLILDHCMELEAPNIVVKSAWEDGAVEYVAEVSKPIYDSVKAGEISHVSVEYDWRVLEKLDGIAPRGLQLTGLSLLKRLTPGDPAASVEVWEGIVNKLKEMKRMSEQTEQERLHQEQKARAGKYGIQPKQGGSLTKPGEYEKIPEDQFADPVNWRYPVDAEHVKGALTYFNQPDNRRDYDHGEQVKVMAKIITAALANNIEVSYQAEDPVYRDLPEELKSRMTGYKKAESEAEACKRVLGEAQKTIRDLTEERDALRAKLSLGEGVVEPGSGLRIPVGYVKADEVLAILPKSVPWEWGWGPHEVVRRIRAKCSQSIQDQPQGRRGIQ